LRIALDDQIAATGDDLGFRWAPALADRTLIADSGQRDAWSILVSDVLSLTRAEAQLVTGAHVRTLGTGRTERVADATERPTPSSLSWTTSDTCNTKFDSLAC
jgi:hypothetical protein